jgi:hypothetical protein
VDCLPRPLPRLLLAAALFLVTLNVHVQMQSGLPVDLDLRAVVARLVLCYVAAFWIDLARRTTLDRPRHPPAAAVPLQADYQARSTE